MKTAMKRMILTAAMMMLTVAGFACTNLIVGKKASVDGSVICTYNCDGFGFASPLTFDAPGRHAEGELIALRAGEPAQTSVSSPRSPTPSVSSD